MALFGSAFSDKSATELIDDYSVFEVLNIEDISKSVLVSLAGRSNNISFGNDSVVLEGAFGLDEGDGETRKALVFVLMGEETQVMVFYDRVYMYASIAENQTILYLKAGTIAELIFGFDGEWRSIFDLNFDNLYSNQTAMRYLSALEEFISLEPITRTDYRLVDLLFPDFFIIVIMWTGIMGTAMTTVKDRVSGVRKRILLTPTSGFSVVFGNTLANMVLIGLQLAIIFSVAVLVYHVAMAGSILLVGFILFITTLCMVGIGLVIANFSRSTDEAFYMSMMISFPMMLLGTAFFSFGRAAWANSVSSILPISYGSQSLRNVMLFGADLGSIGTDLAIIGGFAVAIYLIGVYLTSRGR
jgi:ABC-2 type transport system permease protein